MIELRWVDKGTSIKFDMSKSFATVSKGEKVLQYRQQIQSEPITKNGNLVGLKHIWSEWIDVPTVTGG